MSFRLFQWTTGRSMRRRAAVLGVVALLIVAALSFRSVYVAWHVRVARTALSASAPGKALSALRKAEALASKNPEVLFLIGRALRRTGALDDVHAYLDRAALAGWPENEVRHQRYLLLMQTGNFDQANAYVGEVMRSGADDDLAEEIYEARAKGFLSIYDLKEALLCIDYWLKWRPHARQARLWRAEIWERTARWQDAISEYRTILQDDPQNDGARLKLADALLFEHDAQGALDEYRKCLAAHPDDPAALIGVVKCRQRIGEPSDAKSGLLALLERDLSATQKGEVLMELGEIALLNQDYTLAVDFLARAREADPTNRFVYQPLSRAYARLGKTELAEEAKRRGDESTSRLSRLSEITNAMVQDPQDPELRYEAGMLFFAEGADQEGAAWLYTALKCNPGHRKTHAALADYYERIGDARAGHHRKLAELVEHRDIVTKSNSESP
jgi:tetratricopeptide (TPR) repeat protein